MTVMTATLRVRTLKAALLCAGKNEQRYYLNGIFIDRHNMVATEGKRMMVAKIDDTDLLLQVIIPRQTVEVALKAVPKGHDYVFLIHDDEANRWTLGGLQFEPVDGKYPEYERMLPKAEELSLFRPEGDIAQIQPEFLLDAKKAAELLDAQIGEPFQYTSSGQAVICSSIGFVIIQSMKMADATPLPEWPKG